MKPKEVIEALKMCANYDFRLPNYDFRCGECPYCNDGIACESSLMLDAAALLEKVYGKEERV